MTSLHDAEAAMREIASAQHGLLSRAQARASGLSDSQLHRLPRARWQFLTAHVIRLVGAPPTGGEWAMAAVLDAGRGAALSHAAGSRWWNVPGFGSEAPQIVTTSRSRRRVDGVVVHRVRLLPPEYLTVLNGVPIVRPELMILQLCGTEHPKRAERALDNAWNMRLVSGPSLLRLLIDYGERGRNGSGVLRQLMEARGLDYIPPASNLEARATDVFAPLRITLRRQVDSGGERWTGRVDLRAVEAPLIVEVQSEKYHSALLDRVADAARIAKLECEGFVVVEVTDTELWQRPDDARHRVAAGLARARARARSGVQISR